MITVADMAAGRVPVPLVLQVVLFVSLLAVVSVWDLRYRIIPDRLQAGIALLSLLQFSPKNLLGILGAAPYLLVALLCEKEKGIGGGDVKLAGAMGLVLGLPASLTASCLGLAGFVLYGAAVHLWERHHGKERNLPFPVGPFLAVGAVAAYGMKMGGRIQ